MASWEARLEELGITIAEPLPTRARYASVVIDGTTAFTSGTVAIKGPPYELAFPGCLGDGLSVQEGQQSAAGAMQRTLSNLRGALDGDLDRVQRFLKVTGFVRCAPDFTEVSKVLDGASELLDRVFGEELRPARSAIGVAALPYGASVEIETVVRLEG